MNRNAMLQQIIQTPAWDVVIIGGGATGLGCAVDAASRGYKTLLVEQYDFAKGTSGKSTKLVHGGVRYLQQGNIKLVMEALRERAYLLKNAPHVTSVFPFVVPVFSTWEKYFYGIGLKLYDTLAGKLSLGKTKWLNKQETLQHLNGISDKNLKGGILYYDGQFDDTRLAIDLALTAIKYGATVINYCKASSLIKTKNKITGAELYDAINNKTFTVLSKATINATGVFVDDIMQMDEPLKQKLVAPSQGVHIVVDKKFFPADAAMMIPKTNDKRVLFAVPWHDKVLLGTTDTPVNHISIEPKPLQEEVSFIIYHANKYLAKIITQQDVLSVFAGLRPLIKQKNITSTSMLNRDHTIIVSGSGLITVSGGKWTTYRKIAEDVIDKAIAVAQLEQKSCITKTLKIGDEKNINNKNFLKTGFKLSKENITYFAEHEMAMCIEDVLARRTRILFLDAAAAINVAPVVAKELAITLNKNQDWIDKQIIDFTTLANQYLLPVSENLISI